MSSPFMSELKQRELDIILNKTVLDIVSYSFAGYTAGLVAGVLTRRPYWTRNFLAGIGGSYGYVTNRHNFNVALL